MKTMKIMTSRGQPWKQSYPKQRAFNERYQISHMEQQFLTSDSLSLSGA